MSLLTREDWEKLRTEHEVAFTRMTDKMFDMFLDKIYGPDSLNASAPPKRGQLDEIDALMIHLARAEPPIRPGLTREPPIRPAATREPPIRP